MDRDNGLHAVLDTIPWRELRGRLRSGFEWRRTSRAKLAEGAGPDLGYSTIQVERDDRLATICGKLDAARLPDVAVRIPKGNGELSTPVGMRLLMRHADRAGKSIILVTRRQTVRQIARAEGQQCVGSERRVRFGRSSPVHALLGGLDLPVPAFSTVAWLIGLCLLAGGLAVLVFSVLPDATLTLFPTSTAVSQEALLSLDPVANRVDHAEAVVPATRRRVSVTRTVLLPATGTIGLEQTSGDPVVVPAVAAGDLDLAKNLAPSALTEQALLDLARSYGTAWRFFQQTGDVQVTSVDPAQPPGSAGAFLQVTYRGSVSVLGARESDLRGLLEPALRKQLQSGQQVIDSSVRMSVVRAGPFEKGADRMPVQMRIDAAIAANVDANRIRQQLAGRSRREALAIAERATAASRAPILRLSPGWAPWLPRLGSRVRVELAVPSR